MPRSDARGEHQSGNPGDAEPAAHPDSAADDQTGVLGGQVEGGEQVIEVA
jgi:hypothetical protein